jgi:hypothetical protein
MCVCVCVCVCLVCEIVCEIDSLKFSNSQTLLLNSLHAGVESVDGTESVLFKSVAAMAWEGLAEYCRLHFALTPHLEVGNHLELCECVGVGECECECECEWMSITCAPFAAISLSLSLATSLSVCCKYASQREFIISPLLLNTCCIVALLHYGGIAW